MRGRLSTSPIGLALLGGALLACIMAGVHLRLPGDVGGMPDDRTSAYVLAAGVAGVFYTGAVALSQKKIPGGLGIVLLVGVLARVLTFMPPPLLSTDIYRYVWDGRVQRAGINPYRFLPIDPALAPLRDAGGGAQAIYPNINRADTAPTIYPPAAQLVFAAAAWAWPGLWGVKAALLAFDAMAAGAALWLLRQARLPATRLLIYAWNPLVIWEFAGGGHIDAAATGFVAVALVLSVRRHPGWAGAALGLAVLSKLLPAALFPALWRRWEWRGPAACAGVIALGYAVYARAGWRVFGYLPGYAAEERLGQDGTFLLRLGSSFGPLPGWAGLAYGTGALLVLAGMALWMTRRPGWPAFEPAQIPTRIMLTARDTLWLGTATLVALSPHYPWYFAGLALPAVLVPSASVLWLTLAAPVLYLDPQHNVVVWPALLFLPFAGLLLYERLRPTETLDADAA